MTLGNLAALRQTNIVRMLAYSSIAQGGFILVPLAVAGDVPFAGTIGVAGRRHLHPHLRRDEPRRVRVRDRGRPPHAARRRSRASRAWARPRPRSPSMFTVFLFSLAGIPPLAGWFAKFVMFRAVFDAGTTAAVILGVIAAVNSVIVFFYYAGVARRMWFHEPEAAADSRTLRVPLALTCRARDHERDRARHRHLPASSSPASATSPSAPAECPRRSGAPPGAHPPEGPITFAAFMEAALYDEPRRLLRPGRGRGRAGADFVTARRSDRCSARSSPAPSTSAWAALGEPDPFVVVEAGAGRGRLAADVLRAAPACAPALRYVLVERSAELRARAARAADDRAGRRGARAVRRRAPTRPTPSSRWPASGRSSPSSRELPALRVRGVLLAERAARQPARAASSNAPAAAGPRCGSASPTTPDVRLRRGRSSPRRPALAAEADAVAAGHGARRRAAAGPGGARRLARAGGGGSSPAVAS